MLLPTPTPYASRWNIGGVGSPTRGAGVGHVDFMFFCVDSICVGYPTQTRFLVGYELNGLELKEA